MPTQHLTSVYGNGWQAVLPFMETVVPPSFTTVQPSLTACATVSYKLCNCVLRLIEMVSKQFSPFMEMVMQPSLTACATTSYKMGNCVLRFMETVSKQFSHLWNWLCNPVLQLVQLRLTAYGTASYGLWKWLASSSPYLWERFQKWYERKSAVT